MLVVNQTYENTIEWKTIELIIKLN